MEIKAYSGNYPYIFVSYAHKDKDIVYPFIEELQKHFNVWFDDGIHLGKDYKKEIMTHVTSCSLFLFMVSRYSLESDFCKKEIYFAENKKIRFINILIEEMELPDWFLFDYGHIQSFPLYSYPSLEVAIDDMKRKSSDWFIKCQIIDDKEQKETSKTKAHVKREKKTTPRGVYVDKYDGKLVKVSGSVNEYEVPKDVYIIAANCFKDVDDLERVIIHPGVVRIEENAFRGCDKNVQICFRGRYAPYDCHFYYNPDGCEVVYGYLDDYYRIAKSNVRTKLNIQGDVFYGIEDAEDVLVIPDNVTKISKNAFFCEKKPKIVIIPKSVKTIDKQVFFHSEVEFVYVLGAEEIKNNAFWADEKLIAVDLAESVTSIGKLAFAQCKSLMAIDLPPFLKKIGKDAFFGCENLKEIFLHDEITFIGGALFCSCYSLEIKCEPVRRPIGWSIFWNFYSSPVTWGYGCKSKLCNVHVKDKQN